MSFIPSFKMPSIVPSKNSAFRACKVKSETVSVENLIVKPPTNPHGYTWRTYTEANIRQTLCSDIMKRNFLIASIRRCNQELDTYGLINSIQKYNRYITLQREKEIFTQQLRQINDKVDLHLDYQLYQKFKH